MQRLITLLCALVLITFNLLAITKDTAKVYRFNPVEVISNKDVPFNDRFRFGTDYNSDIMDKNGKSLIRRGLNFTQDLYSEGFKRGDIKIAIDGEQYHTACPNRMDAPASRINPLEMESLEMTKSGSIRGSGLYGKIEYHRRQLEDNWRLSAYMMGNAAAQKDFDGGININGMSHSATLRLSTGKPYLSGDDRSFKNLYGYKDNYSYNNAAISMRGLSGSVDYGASFNFLENLSFPYLQMDEMHTKTYSSNVAFKKNKLYFNYTDHLMNNTHRFSDTVSFMESSAKNLTIGLIGENYEFTYRNWKADNFIKPVKAPQLAINNNMMPDISQIYGGLNYSLDISEDLIASARAGMQYFKVGNAAALDMYKLIYSDVKDNRIFASGAVNLTYSLPITDNYMLALTGEGALEAPEAEQLFINIKRPGANPNWSGNPTLKQPFKSGFRVAVTNEFFRLEGFFNHVANYVNINSDSIPGKKFQTYDNVAAQLAGANVTLKYSIFESNISYLYGQNVTEKRPLSEIMPLAVTNTLSIPEVFGVKSYIIHKYENMQSRVDTYLKEPVSSSWNTLGIRFGYNYSNFAFRLEVDNLLDYNYSRHLSFARNPFSSGVKVFEPGRTVRLTVMFDQIFAD